MTFSDASTSKPKCVVIASGGLDSTTLVYSVRHVGYNVVMLSFNYGQRHMIELEYARKTAMTLDVPHFIVDLSSLSSLFSASASALVNPRMTVPDGHYTNEVMKATIVPNRNAIMLSIAYGYAVSIDAEAVGIGTHAGDHAIYPDCRPQFLNAFQTMQHESFGGLEMAFKTPLMFAPFLHKTKTEIALKAKMLGVPILDTYSCYKGQTVHCGRCGTCVERQEALHDAGVPDPTPYIDSSFWKTEVARFKNTQQ